MCFYRELAVLEHSLAMFQDTACVLSSSTTFLTHTWPDQKLYSIPKLSVHVGKLLSRVMQLSRQGNLHTFGVKQLYAADTKASCEPLRRSACAGAPHLRCCLYWGPHGCRRIRARPPTTTQKEGQLRSAAKYRETSVKASSHVYF
jgi:hypothetical protein